MYSPRYNASEYMEVLIYINEYWPRIKQEPPPKEVTQDTLLSLPHPYLIPSDTTMFQEMYYWDSYFMALGLEGMKEDELIIDIAENMAYLLDKFGMIPNATRLYFLSRSQPPFFTKLIRLAYTVKLARGHSDAKVFLHRMMRFAEREHDTVWLGERHPHYRLVDKDVGLSRYFDTNYLHELACCESGWDHSPRCNDQWLDHLQVDLNSILYAREMDFAEADDELGRPWRAEQWRKRARGRAEQMWKLMWDDNQNLFFDVKFEPVQRGQQSGYTYTRNPIPSLAGFYPMWAELADTEEQKEKFGRMVDTWIADPDTKPHLNFMRSGGLATTTRNINGDAEVPTRNPVSQERYQWVWPNGWAPLQWIVARGLENYEFSKQAKEVRQRWCDTCVTVFQKSRHLWEKYNVETVGDPPVSAGYDSQNKYDDQKNKDWFGSVSGFGWSNAVFKAFIKALNPRGVRH